MLRRARRPTRRRRPGPAGRFVTLFACARRAATRVSPSATQAQAVFASGCQFLISVTSAGQIVDEGQPPYFVVIDRALRDEGTSYHYLPPAEFAEADPGPVSIAQRAVLAAGVPLRRGASWTTDAPFRETAAALETARTHGILAVEMEAAALYAFAIHSSRPSTVTWWRWVPSRCVGVPSHPTGLRNSRASPGWSPTAIRRAVASGPAAASWAARNGVSSP